MTSDAVIQLFPHQLSAIERMRKLETEDVYSTEDATIRTSLGLYTDKPGSGKSYAILAHLLSFPKLPEQSSPERRGFITTHMRSAHGDRVLELRALCGAGRRVLPTNVLLVPPSTFAQWETYVRQLLPGRNNDRARRVKALRRCDRASWMKLVGDCDSGAAPEILLVNTSAYAGLSEHAASAGVVFQRLVIDEADSIHVKHFRFVDALFLWIVTATPQTLSTSACRCSPIRAMFFGGGRGTWESESMRFVRSYLQICHEEAVIDAALNLPPPSTRTARVARSHLFSGIRSYLTPAALGALEASDHQGALTALGCSPAEGDEGIIAALVAKLEREVSDLSLQLREQEGDEEEASADGNACDELANRIAKRRRIIRNIMIRVREAGCCPIGLDPIEHKAVTPCCQNAFEFGNLVKALSRSLTCPLCKSGIRPQDLVVSASSSGGGDCSGKPPASAGVHPTKEWALRHELLDALKDWRTSNARVLLFSCYATISARRVLDELGVPYYSADYYTKVLPREELERFRRGECRVLLLNAHNVGAGVNLECATHVFMMYHMRPDLYSQVIGRAQRLGRSGPLHVVNVRFEDEQQE